MSGWLAALAVDEHVQITAIYHDGVLTLTIPVAEQAKPHKIELTHVGSVAQAVEAATVTA